MARVIQTEKQKEYYMVGVEADSYKEAKELALLNYRNHLKELQLYDKKERAETDEEWV